jgi:hypothetical protein
LGAEAVERVLEAQGELVSFRRFQAMPQHRHTPMDRQLHRFLGTRATRKIRSARRLVEALDPGRLPRPLVLLAARLLVAATAAPTPSIEATSQSPLRALWATPHVKGSVR